MTTRGRKLAVAALVSVGLLGLVAYSARFNLPDLSQADPAWLAGVLLAQLVLILSRAATFRALASAHSRATNLQWIQLAARHQLVFSIVPGGIGDLGFPYFAKRVAGLEAPAALRVVAQLRLRDAICVAIIAFAALILLGLPQIFGLLGIAIALPALWFADEVAASILRVLAHFAPGSRLVSLLREASRHEKVDVTGRAARTIPAMLAWIASIASIVAVFRAIGHPLSFGDSLLFITALNVARAISLSIAGLGVSEAGATAALVASGSTMQNASSLALITRPMLLVLMVGLSLTLDVGARALISRRRLKRAPSDY